MSVCKSPDFFQLGYYTQNTSIEIMETICYTVGQQYMEEEERIMNNESLEKEIFDAIVERMGLAEVIAELPPEKLAYDTPLFESMDSEGIALDSIDALELVVLLQEKYGITVLDEDMSRLVSAARIAEFVAEKKTGGV